MELMDTSLDKFYKFIYERLKQRIPEDILGKITVAVSDTCNGLDEYRITRFVIFCNYF